MNQNCQRDILKIVLLFVLVIWANFSYAQPCTGSISLFPYNEGFETTDGNWISGGTVSDWAWGTPTKTVISTAGGGIRSWVTGGLTNSSYNNGENSWLQSPCFDFSTLQYPKISFKIFWETERKFDGASFQYSIDGGNSWSYLGTINSNSNCDGENWFNATGITYLSNATGWSGNIQSNSGSCLGGSGSGAWLTAKHTLTSLAGQSNVRFRFLFGAGTTCNAYDGFAIDDIQIAEAPPNTASFTSSCISNSKVSFTSMASCASSYLWNFGDIASGASNTSTAANPTHIYYAPGTYNVSLTTNFVLGPAAISNKVVVIIGLTAATTWPGRCTGVADATLGVTPTGSAFGYFYNWNTTPAQTTSSISNVGPGTYTVIASAINACNSSVVFIVDAPIPIIINPIVTDASCSISNGSINPNVSGGLPPYQYSWSNAASTATIQNLAAGNYSLLLRDASGCSSSSGNIVVNNQVNNVPVNLGADFSICTGQTALLNPGTFASYLWQDNSTNPTFTVTTAGVYFVKITNAVGCNGSDTVNVTIDCTDIYFPSAFTPNNDTYNDGFGPLGKLSAVKNYKLSVYNRYGQCIFTSTDPYKKWDGTYKGDKPNAGSFVWVSDYLFNGKHQSRKGTITMIR
jgi:gliding motility-associated-like protein